MGIQKARKKINKKITALIITALVFSAVSVLHLVGAFRYLEYKSYDLRVRFFADSSLPAHDIMVVLLDQSSIDWAQKERGWGWPWPRRAYGELLDYMKLGEAASVAFDILYSESSMYRSRDDEAFARASAEYGKTVQAVFFSSQTGSARAWPSGIATPVFEPMNFWKKLDQFGIGRYGQVLDGGQFPIQQLSKSAAVLGSITGTPDSDDVVRRMKLFTLFDGKAVPGLAAASLLAAGHDTNISYNPRKKIIQWGNFAIPVDNNGASLLRYRGDLSRYVPFLVKDILQSAESYARGEEPIYPPEDFTGCYVFFGLYAPGLFDIFASPISSLYPGMGAHITMLDNILKGDFIRESSQWLNLLILFAVVGFIVALCLFSNRILLTVGGTILAAAGIVAAAFAAYNGGLWLPLVVHLAGMGIAFISATLYNYATEGSQKRFIKSAFSQYLSPKVIEQIIADPSQLQLGGEKRAMTAIFTDVRSFSTISEALGDPTKLVELLNFYLTRMSNIVLDNQGTIDKYEGDAIIAFFGAPVHYDNHAALACRSAVMMKKAEADINREALALGLITGAVMEAMTKKGILSSVDDPCPLFTRLGVNSGEMVVGNMGTPSKMDYTIMGNAVNLAARLEGVN
ncbi:MAG: adenylate/guanylate cyclase domain-containing protein, partial [Treponema sp.]|nr:adenylate/guanylate cyclase domain-containing protein [Treponema sp.]